MESGHVLTSDIESAPHGKTRGSQSFCRVTDVTNTLGPKRPASHNGLLHLMDLVVADEYRSLVVHAYLLAY